MSAQAICTRDFLSSVDLDKLISSPAIPQQGRKGIQLCPLGRLFGQRNRLQGSEFLFGLLEVHRVGVRVRP
jgi:hypothetical protein